MEKLKQKKGLLLFLFIESILFLTVVLISIYVSKLALPLALALGIVTLFSLLIYFCPSFFKDGDKRHSKYKVLNRIYFYLEKKENKTILFRRIIAVFLALLFLSRFMSGYDYLEGVDNLVSPFMSSFEVGVSVLLNQWWVGALFLIVINEFVRSKAFTTLVKFISTPIFILSTFFLPQILMGICGNIYSDNFDFRVVLIAIEYGICVSFIINVRIKDHTFKLNKSSRYALIVGIILVLFTSINCYMPHIFFGESIYFLPLPKDINFTHRLWIYIGFLLPVFYFLLLYPFDGRHRRALLAFIAITVFFSYASIRRYQTWTNVPALPLHLCVTAMYVIPLTLIFKSHKLFYFTMFINVIGALLALLMPNLPSDAGSLSTATIEFFINHIYAFFMPVLIVLLGVYERPKMKYFLYSMVGFFFYFVLVLFINSYYGTDFFFTNSNFIADKLGDWANNLFNISWSFTINNSTFTFHPLYQLVFYLVYVVFAFIMWYVYELLFRVVDSLVQLKERNKNYKESEFEFKLLQKERGIDMKKEKIDWENLNATLKIEHLKKRYGNAKVNAVNDFSLYLEGGKIYGFLGKNGAGKSTIIKSIVGMHSFNGGEISVCGFDIEHQPVEAKECIGFVPDHYALYENLTGRQYINYIADLYDVSDDDRIERLKDLLPRLEMESKFDLQMKTYSHGMKQKITIIGALIHNPKIWILDEPMTGVDPISIFQIKECMREHAKKGNIVFFSSHLIDVVTNLCDEVIIIRHGDFILKTSLEELNKNNINLETLFLEKTADTKEESEQLLKLEKIMDK